ncbi:uncharacterized protein DUF742 [Actinomadura hallensis]|uniref:Uncharacterized protein DUF742 n=1 Tax=Actinomadura hallensis TaxID=337895 RepID=A0A543IJX6_9ACTN|nr:DUF742 domain-containing protein [Actinomadura hallensis]TQM70875.1 uncharacterized protein DUF742 [Actinomadura hallensis]HLV73107.1 DUF742 domain-containing protein [Vulgatibacteraceae bacterium]
MTAGDDEARPPEEDEVWLDDDAGLLVRPYTVTAGRTHPTVHLDILTLVVTVRLAPALDPEYARALELCRTPTSVAEVAGQLRLPMAVTKVLLSDLVDRGAMTVQEAQTAADPTDRALLEKLLDGLQRV